MEKATLPSVQFVHIPPSMISRGSQLPTANGHVRSFSTGGWSAGAGGKTAVGRQDKDSRETRGNVSGV